MEIAFFGNSLVADSYGGSFVSVVASRLPAHIIINAGKNGDTIFNLLQRLDMLLDERPDEMVVLCGGNDAISYSQPDTRLYYERVLGVPNGVVTPEMFASAFRDLLTRIQLAHIITRVILPPMEYNPSTVSAMHQYNALMRETCAVFNVPVLDLMKALSPATVPDRPPLNQAVINFVGERLASGWNNYEGERQRGGYTYSFDGIHFTPETAQRVAGWVIAFLKLE